MAQKAIQASMTNRQFLLIGLMLLLLPFRGYAAKRPELTDIVIPLACITGNVVLTDCVNADPTHCKHAVIVYKPGCELVMPKRERISTLNVLIFHNQCLESPTKA